jgi:hypothetical protein
MAIFLPTQVSFALPGNQREYSSLESMVGNNTTLRRFASWVYNPNIIDTHQIKTIDM